MTRDHLGDLRVPCEADPGGAQLPAWTPGAHIDLLLDDTVRQYSLCGPAGDQHTWRIAILLDQGGRGGSVKVHETLNAGDRVAALSAEPRNGRWLRQGV